MVIWFCVTCNKWIESKDFADVRRHKCVVAPKVPTVELPWTLRINRPVTSQNKTEWAHWSVVRKGRRAWTAELAPLLQHTLAGCQFSYSSWRLTRCYGGRARELDFANFVGGAKPIPDALQELGVIVDDRPSAFHCEYVQLRVEEPTCYTLLTLESWRHD